MRQVVLDTETTGIDPKQGHRIIEIGCVEMIGRKLTKRHFHVYINPDREVEEEAFQVHGISNEFLADKPRFHEIAQEFLDFIRGAELIIHNAPFDVGFMDHEFSMLGNFPKTRDVCEIFDSLVFARKKHPGAKNNLDALCRRYGIDNSHRELHGALLDSEILADVYLLMTGGQTSLGLSMNDGSEGGDSDNVGEIRRLSPDRPMLKVLRANETEMAAHEERLDLIDKKSGQSLWRS
ncbi:DNA polymerase III subunit epsilon [Marinomonas mediterranea]|jgi:DNA polymerase III, epsilon subunit, Proteobacterial|uniref:DNA polymerase III subunit epsilon n=1 Tax=Marinomonas mediterranea (strain ATCC 700492 / JCM 21426 / NBRC 103028 / MMB-1) TaxID=717774 RepID=F2JZU7_MARM1|nr:DNA polymerase III subunit epsilon [Marinomonas mediterranea]ADZ92059.1 DNA polymerase III, epsilon subunit [Marinomonas mediterranea MMB-1]WCN10023.1 DNA polymerase III subunit epsilon [Marinomonas mediterranea]WCN18129.1 DNA polymerase III subunit epsilon [Marinomonas mediterranea MMB-1]